MDHAQLVLTPAIWEERGPSGRSQGREAEGPEKDEGMDSGRFDRLLQHVIAVASRRGLLRAGVATLAATAGVALGLRAGFDVAAKKKKKKKRKRKACLSPKVTCPPGSLSQCCEDFVPTCCPQGSSAICCPAGDFCCPFGSIIDCSETGPAGCNA
jgi:hypothetical protein